MREEYDFSKGERAKFYSPDAVFSFPVYLEPDVNDFISQLADEREIDIQELVNEWLRVNIRLIQSIDVGGGKQGCIIVCHIFTWQEDRHQLDHVLLDSISGFTPELA